MAFKLNGFTFVRANPAPDADSFVGLGNGKILFGTGKKFDEDPANVWFNVFGFGGGDGWIPKANCDEVPDPERPEVDAESFLRHCLVEERSFNLIPTTAPWFVAADFLIARALIETGITNPGPVTGSDAVGPLRMTSAEWENFLKSESPQAAEFGPKDFNFPMLQVHAAAHSMHADAKAISDAKPKGPKDDPFLPSYLDLFHAYLTDPKAAIAIRDAGADAAKKVSDVLTADQIAGVKARSKFKTVNGAMLVSDFIKLTEAALSDGLTEAFDLVKKFAPDELPQVKPGNAPWLAFAQTEMKEGVTEKTHPDRIKAYFAATNFGPVGAAIPHWCGAFVADCIKKSGQQPILKGGAGAANWKQWGQSVPAGSSEIPLGAVIVLTPAPGTNTSGHVAFFTQSLPATKQVKLLGGNQDDGVNEKAFAASSVVAIRWLETAPAGIGAATGKFNLKAAGIPEKFFQFGDMIVDHFSRAGFTPEQQIGALANAIGESGLNPQAESPLPERSFGLFQCNQKAGLGIGFSTPQLFDPATNIGLVIKEAKKFKAFTGAKSINDAVAAFVTFIERPKRPEVEIPKRQAIAAKLMA